MNNPNSIHTLSHTTWNCKYHIVLAPKYRRKVFLEENEGKDDFIVRLTGKIRMNMYFREGDKEAYVSHT